ncbi:hypothetical protein [Mesorhizobium sp. B2-3-10]|uniref:hypothetical protein n=1 Tax=Mesorhizobium sp. B2-3-10 TaxID=2589954 RepID=UPI0011285835|nr:hypothetical protein [Mesorhizobium sp. B2-3-10]TPL94762.1 hypothetical protein FJ943_25085 [Mesorhizobium sp. B2-3-10]
MSTFVRLRIGAGERSLHIRDFYRPYTALFKAAGYLAHCPCGCSPATKPEPQQGDYQPRFWEKTPDDALFVYARLEPASGHYGQIRYRHCGAIAARLTELKEQAIRLDSGIGPTLECLIEAFEYHARYRINVLLS